MYLQPRMRRILVSAIDEERNRMLRQLVSGGLLLAAIAAGLACGPFASPTTTATSTTTSTTLDLRAVKRVETRFGEELGTGLNRLNDIVSYDFWYQWAGAMEGNPRDFSQDYHSYFYNEDGYAEPDWGTRWSRLSNLTAGYDGMDTATQLGSGELDKAVLGALGYRVDADGRIDATERQAKLIRQLDVIQATVKAVTGDLKDLRAGVGYRPGRKDDEMYVAWLKTEARAVAQVSSLRATVIEQLGSIQ